MKQILLATAALVGLSSAALAADMPVKAPPIVAPVAFSWTGCYIGANAGWVQSRNRYELDPAGYYTNAAGIEAPPNRFGTGALLGDLNSVRSRYTVEESGWEAGGQVGCNTQKGMWVVGFEGDAQWKDMSHTLSALYPNLPSENAAFRIPAREEIVTTKQDWFSTVRLRVGAAFDRLLIYGTAGFAVAHLDSSASVSFAPTIPGFTGLLVYPGALHFGSESTIRGGWTAGAGIEWAFANNWSVKGEYLYLDFGRRSFFSPLINAPVAGYTWLTSVDTREHVARVGINYRFDWAAGAPVVARY